MREQERPATQAATPPTPPARRGIVWTPRLVIWSIILVVVLIFIVANFDSVPLSYLFGEQDGPLALWLLIFLGLGYVLGWMRPHFRPKHRG